MSTFPVISRSPKHDFTEELSPEAIQVASKASGLPVVNKLFTFDPKTWGVEYGLVIQADKDTLMAFYEANKDVPFDWANTQDGNTYEVIFAGPPKCKLDRLKTRWNISITFLQYSPL